MANSKDEKVDGARIAAQILMRMSPSAQERIVQAMEKSAPEVLTKVQEKMLSINDIASLSAQSIQVLLKEIDHRDVVAALNSADDHIKDAVFQNISARKRQIIEEDLSHARDLSPLEVETAQKRIVVKMDELIEKGKIRSDAKDGTWA